MQAQLYDVFVQEMINLIATASITALSNQGLDQRVWRIPQFWDAPPWDIPEIAPPFDRTEIGVAYASFFAGDGQTSDIMAAKLQSDHLASQERAFRMRHATHVRCGMHAAARRTGQGDPGAGSFARIANFVVDTILSGG